MADTAIKKLTSMEPYSVTEPSPYEAALKEVGYKKPETKQQEKFLKDKAEADIKVAGEKKRLGEESVKRIEEIYGRPELQQQKLDAFTPSQESGSDLAKLFALTTAIAFIGGGRGRYSGMTAMNNLASAMEGYRKGRKDLFAQEMKEYDKNMKAALENNRIIQGHLEKYLALAAKKDANAATELEMIKALTGRQGALAEIEKLTENDKAKTAETLAKSRADWKKHVDDMMEKERRHRELIAQRQAKGTTSSALLAGRAENIREAFAQAAVDIVNITKFPKDTMLGALAGLTGTSGDTLVKGIRNSIARGVTSTEQRMLQQLVAGIEGHLAFALGGGYATSQSKARMDQYKAQIAQAGDDPANAALFLARLKQEMNILADNFESKPGVSKEMNAAVQKYNDQINRAVPFDVDDVIQATIGKETKSEPSSSRSSVNVQEERSRAKAAIAAGKDEDAVRERFKKKTGEEL